MHKGMPSQAVGSFHKALGIDFNSVMAHINIANAYLTLGNIDKSIEHNKQAIRIKPDFGMAHNNLAVALHHNGDGEGAREQARKALDLGYEVNPEFLKTIGLR
jgi:Tfp pilus assembly protein PilF